MSVALRLLLVFAAICLTAFVFHSVKKAKMRIEDGLFWVLLSFFILLLSVFPGIAYALASVFGFQAPVNFVFIFFIFVLLVKGFTTSRHVSQLENKVKELSQQVAIDRLDHYERVDSKDGSRTNR